MKILVPDNALTMRGDLMRSFLSDVGIQLEVPPVKESWSHGIMERCVQEIKTVASKLTLSHPEMSVQNVLALTTMALNSTETARGFSPYQWVYGQKFTLDDEDERTMAQLTPSTAALDFTQLMVNRREAEAMARQVHAQRVLVKLKNSKVRQPLQVFKPMDLVKIWRKYSADGGPRGGLKKISRPQWLGPGRVVFHEVIHGQHEGDERRHIVWVIVGGSMHRCSVHSVRKVNERERLEYELHNPEDPAQWQSLADMIPNRSYIDVTNEEPDENEEEGPHLPLQPDADTMKMPEYVPKTRHTTKSGPKWHQVFPPPAEPMPSILEELPPVPPDTALDENDVVPSPSTPADDPLNDYGDPTYVPDSDEDVGNTGIGSGRGDSDAPDDGLSQQQPLLQPRASSDKPPPSNEPESKRQRVEDEEQALYNCFMEVEECYMLSVELDVTSQRQKQQFVKHPSLFLAQKMRDCEVRLTRLKPEHRKLFDRAKTKEVNSFISNAAVRRCLDLAEENEAKNSGRLMRCRWVLTWKPTPEESLDEARQEVSERPDSTTLTADARRKAKARIVLLGYEHPDLLTEAHKTSSPVQAVLTRNLSYQLVMQMGWNIEGIDMSTAFLQTLPTEEEKRLWTSGVKELREALQIPEGGVMRILKNFYGSTTAPRNLWENVNQSMLELGGTRIKGDKCFWLWTEKVQDENGDVLTRPLGFMAGHVDDFHRAGNENSAAWKQIKQSIDQRYKWGSVKLNAYRHAGTDLEIVNDATLGRCLVVDQSYYVETLQDIDITPERFCQGDATMTPKEISACRTSLGALQWLAVQTQPLICARCNLLITELAGSPVMRTAQEIQELVRELRKHSTQLKFFKLPHVKTWKDVCVVGLGDQAHNNRPRGGSTGGMLVFLAGPEIAMGKPNPMVLVAWKSWKLKRVAISSNDAEVQALVETEDAVYRTRLLWAELNGAGKLSESRDLLTASVAEVRLVPGLLGTDSRGGYDSIIINESPLLGLSQHSCRLAS